MIDNQIVVQPAKVTDAQDIAELQMDAFCDEYFQELFPPKDGIGLKYSTSSWESLITEAERRTSGIHPTIHIIRGDDGKLLAASSYYIVPPGYTAKDIANWRERWGKPLPGMKESKLAEFFEGMGTQHEAVMSEQPHLFLEVIMTHSSARRRGYATALLAHGNKMADDVKLASYLDSEADAMSLYQKLGYVYQEAAQTESPMRPMMRPPIST